MCRRGSERKLKRMVVADPEECMGRVLSAYGTPLTEFLLFNYFGRMMLSSNDYWPVVEHNLQRVWGKWVRLVKILGREVVDRRIEGSGGAIGANFWVSNIGNESLDGEGPRGFTPLGGTVDVMHVTQTST